MPATGQVIETKNEHMFKSSAGLYDCGHFRVFKLKSKGRRLRTGPKYSESLPVFFPKRKPIVSKDRHADLINILAVDEIVIL